MCQESWKKEMKMLSLEKRRQMYYNLGEKKKRERDRILVKYLCPSYQLEEN